MFVDSLCQNEFSPVPKYNIAKSLTGIPCRRYLWMRESRNNQRKLYPGEYSTKIDTERLRPEIQRLTISYAIDIINVLLSHT